MKTVIGLESGDVILTTHLCFRRFASKMERMPPLCPKACDPDTIQLSTAEKKSQPYYVLLHWNTLSFRWVVHETFPSRQQGFSPHIISC